MQLTHDALFTIQLLPIVSLLNMSRVDATQVDVICKMAITTILD